MPDKPPRLARNVPFMGSAREPGFDGLAPPARVVRNLLGPPRQLTTSLLKRLAKYTVQQCFRNTVLEDYHASTIPDSHTGDFSDVVVRTPHVEIPWPVFRASTTRKWTWWCGTSSIRGCEYRESIAHVVGVEPPRGAMESG